MLLLQIALLAVPLAFAYQDIRLLRSQSGPSGKISGSRFEFDELRSRFVYPGDKSLAVFFEWEAPAGTHALTAYWKGPDGRTLSISPEVKMETTSKELNCLWTFEIADHMPAGVWTVEVRVDGRPAGSHAFELIIPERPVVKEPVAPPSAAPTLDEIYRTAGASIVWVHKLDTAGRRFDVCLGFVVAANAVATAFQCVDSATSLAVEFSDGASRTATELAAWNRVADWAVIAVSTGDTKPLPLADPKSVAVGQRLIVFNVEANLARVIGGVDVSGRRTVPVSGERILLSASPSAEAVGGPLLDGEGRVAGIVGGTLTPGARVDHVQMSLSPGLWSAMNTGVAAVPVSLLPARFESRTSLQALASQGVLTPRLQASSEFKYGGTTREIPKRGAEVHVADVSQFSRRDPLVAVYALVERTGKRSKGMFSGKVYDIQNRMRVDVTPRKVSLSGVPSRLSFGFSPAALEPGAYRIDLLWDGSPFWRTWITVSD